MNDRITFTLVANAGVLVEYNGVGILVDGIHHENGHPFSRVSEEDLKLMRQGAGIFANLHYLLFTHEHPDHFSPQCVAQYIDLSKVKGMLLPNESCASPELAVLLDHVRQHDIPCWTLGLAPGATKKIELTEELVVTALGTRHMGPQYQTVCNDCFLLTVAGKNLLFTGDADHVRAYFEHALAGVSLDTVFVNPIFYHNPHGQEIINTIFRPRDVVIYHMPFAQDDTMRFSSMVRKDMQRHRRTDLRTHVFCYEKQSLSLSSSPSR